MVETYRKRRKPMVRNLGARSQNGDVEPFKTDSGWRVESIWPSRQTSVIFSPESLWFLHHLRGTKVSG